MFFVKKYWKIDNALSNVRKLKFTKIITPNFEINLILEKLENGKISFKYSDGSLIYSSGEFYFQEIKND